MEQVKGFLNEESLARKFLGRSKIFRANLLKKDSLLGNFLAEDFFAWMCINMRVFENRWP